MKSLHIRFQEARGNRTQEQMDSSIGIKQQAYGRYEKGEVLPGVEALQKVCFTLGVPADRLLGLDDGAPPSIRANRAVVAIGVGDTTSSMYHFDCCDCRRVACLTQLVEKLTKQ